MLELHYPIVTKTILERQYPGKPTLKVAFGNGNGAIFENSSKLRASLFVTSRWPRSSGQTNYQVHHPPLVCLLLELSEMHEVRTFAPCKAFLFDMFAFFSSLENYFGFRTTNVQGKMDHSVSLRWNKKFWTFPKRRVFFWLCIRFICELISHSLAGLN